MDPGTFLLVAGVLLIIFSGLVAFQVMPGFTAKAPGGVDITVTTRASKTIPGTTLEVRTALLIGWFLMGCVLTTAGVFVVLDNQALTRQERLAQIQDDVQRRIDEAAASPTRFQVSPQPTLAETPTPLVGPRPTTTVVPVTGVLTVRSADALFAEAFAADQAGKNDEAIAGYQAALKAGLSGDDATLARIEIGLLESLALVSPEVQASRVEVASRCANAQSNLTKAANAETSVALKDTARETLVQIEPLCTAR